MAVAPWPQHSRAACPTTDHVLGDQACSHGSRHQPQMVVVVVATLRCLVVVVGLFSHSRMHIFFVIPIKLILNAHIIHF
jgi:hypothetical protein